MLGYTVFVNSDEIWIKVIETGINDDEREEP
jgi:hypothetical protein